MSSLYYLHLKSNTLYLERGRVICSCHLYENDRDRISVSLGAITFHQVQVTDLIRPGETVVLYEQVKSGRLFLRPQRMFDDPERFKLLSLLESQSELKEIKSQ